MNLGKTLDDNDVINKLLVKLIARNKPDFSSYITELAVAFLMSPSLNLYVIFSIYLVL